MAIKNSFPLFSALSTFCITFVTMKTKVFLILGVFFIFFQGLQAQAFGQDQKTAAKNSPTAWQPQVQLSLGTSFSTFYPGITGFNSWVTPSIHMPINKKWSVTAGLSYSNFLLSGTPEIADRKSNLQNYGTLFVEGHYKVNDKLTVTAAGYKTFSLTPRIAQDKVNPRAIDLSNSGALLQIDYKVNEHFRINASFSMEKRAYPYYPGFGYGGVGGYNRAPVFAPFPGGYYPGF